MTLFKQNTVFYLIVCTLIISCKNNNQNKTTDTNNTTKTLSDNELLDTIQKQTFNYFWEGAEPNSGLARERIIWIMFIQRLQKTQSQQAEVVLVSWLF